MSGHSKWSTIKHKKGAQDAKRGKLFSKISKEIMVAAKLGGGDPASNQRLKSAILKARSVSMPNKNIDSAIKSGEGSKEGDNYEEITYEGYGPDGVAILVQCLTDNKNRTVADVRASLSKNGGRMGEGGSVAWQFEQKGLISIEKNVVSEEELMELALEAGGQDVEIESDGYTVITDMASFHEVYEKLKEKISKIEAAELAFLPKNTIKLNKEKADKVEKILGLLDDLDDVQSVSSNLEVE